MPASGRRSTKKELQSARRAQAERPIIVTSDRARPKEATPSITPSDSVGGGEESVWHAREIAEILHDLDANPDGLNAEEAARRLAKYGPNELPAAARESAFRRLLAQFDNLLIYVLIGAAGISALLGHAIDASVILAVVVLNAVIGFVQEGRAEQALDAIRDMISPKASVLREGRRVTPPEQGA